MTPPFALDEPARSSRGARRRDRPVHRADLDGLRAFAILLVVVYHVWLGRVSGGVDVFLLLSAYFLTASFLRRADVLEPRSLWGFWWRRFARLVPPAAVTIVGVLAFAAIALPASQWRELWSQAWASLLYMQNWELMAAAVDYYARTAVFPSALQHFWSLSVQGQAFLLLPIVLVASVLFARRCGRSPRLVVSLMFGLLFLLSFAFSVFLTTVDQRAAYFHTGARLWEFALGVLAAVILPSLRISARLGRALGWGGLLALVSCGLVLDVEAGFPGVAALWPTLAAVAIIAAGQASTRSGASRFLSSAGLQWLARIAYPLYLVHWPILIAVMVVGNTPRVGLVTGSLIILLSVAVAWALNRGLERRLLPVLGDPRRALAAIVVPTMVAALPLAAWQASTAVRSALIGSEAYPGGAVLMPWIGVAAEPRRDFVPRGTELDDEWVSLGGRCSDENAPSTWMLSATCTERISDPAAPTMLIVGNSHAQQLIASFLPVLESEGWNAVALLKGGCQLAPDEDAEDDCRQWRDEALAYAIASPAAVVVTLGTRTMVDALEERVPHGLDRVVSDLVGSGSQVILVRDNPRFSFDMFACAETAHDAAACGVPQSAVLADIDPALSLASDDRVHAIDLSDYFCPEATCTPVIGNVAVYMDDNHPTATYMATLAPAVRAALAELPGVPIG